MALRIPVSQEPSYVEQVTIEDAVYRLRFHWNYRGQFWALDILDVNDVVIVAGIKLVISYGLLTPYLYLKIPRGFLSVIDPANPYLELSRNDLGVRAQLIYLTGAEIAAL